MTPNSGDNGYLLVAVSAPDDLIELRGRGRDRIERTIATFGDFEMIKHERATTVAQLNAQDAKDILRATYRPRNVAPQSVTLSLDLLLFRVSGSSK